MSPEDRVLDALQVCCERWGIAKVTIDDVARESAISRATIYRLFPGGKDVLHEALRDRRMREFFELLRDGVSRADTLEDMVVTTAVVSTLELRADDHLAAMLSMSPGETLDHLTVDGLPRIIDNAIATLSPLLRGHIPDDRVEPLVDVLARLVLSYFLAPNDSIDLGDDRSARVFLRPFLTALVPDAHLQSVH